MEVERNIFLHFNICNAILASVRIAVRVQSEIPMAKKTVSFNKTGIAKLPDNKPVLYRIQSEGGKTNYAGIAKRGRVQERLEEHLPGGKDAVPGAKVQIEQMTRVEQAKEVEARVIARSKPKYNEQGK